MSRILSPDLAVLAVVDSKSGPVAVMERTRKSVSRYPFPFLLQVLDMAAKGWEKTA